MTLPKVLLVDDLKVNFEMASLVLEKICDLVWVDNGHEAIKVLQDGLKVDLILLDIMMPVMNGYDACRIIKSDEDLKHIPIIFITALGEVRDEQLGIDLGASDYIIRPFSPAILRARVSTYLALATKDKQNELTLSKYANELFQDKLKLIECLAIAVDSRHKEPQYHVKRVADYSCVIARAAGVNELEISVIRIAALLHDVGKISLPDALLDHAHGFSQEELETIKQHGVLGLHLFNDYSGHLIDTIKQVTRSHHEKWDGTGYPDKLKGKEIPLAARIIAIADAFDRKTASDSGKRVWTVSEAISYLEHRSGDFFDPMLVPYVRANEQDFARICNDEYALPADKNISKWTSIFKSKHH